MKPRNRYTPSEQAFSRAAGVAKAYKHQASPFHYILGKGLEGKHVFPFAVGEPEGDCGQSPLVLAEQALNE